MTSRRVQKAAEAIREVVSMAILADLKDPRIEHVTVTYVEVSPDMRVAKVHVSIMGDDTTQRLCLQGLQSSAGFLQKKISRRIDTRYTPPPPIRNRHGREKVDRTSQNAGECVTRRSPTNRRSAVPLHGFRSSKNRPIVFNQNDPTDGISYSHSFSH